MFTLHVIQRIGRCLKRCPFVDRSCKIKGGDSKNIRYFSLMQSLVPLENSFKTQPWTQPFCSYNFRLHLPRSNRQNFFSTSNGLLNGSSLSQAELKKAMDELTDQFMETRELLEDARESVGSVYFSDDMQEASDSVTKTLEDYQGLLDKISKEQKQEVVRTIGLKMEELKAQQQALITEDH